MSSIEKRLRDELGELASWLIDRRAESSSVEQADSGSDSIPRDSGILVIRYLGWIWTPTRCARAVGAVWSGSPRCWC